MLKVEVPTVANWIQSVSEHQVVNKPNDELRSLASSLSQQLPSILEEWGQLAGLLHPLVYHLRYILEILEIRY